MLPINKLRSQSRAAEQAVAHMLWDGIARRHPADRALAAYMRERHQLGSRDRRLISELVYAALRWWGWLRDLAPAGFRQALDEAVQAGGTDADLAPGASGPGEEWHPFLLAAMLLDGVDARSIAEYWVNAGERPPQWLARVPTLQDPAERMNILRSALLRSGPAPLPSLERLIPDWVPAEISPARPIGELIRWLQRRPPMWLRIQRGDPVAVLAELRALDPDAKPHPRFPAAVQMSRSSSNLYLEPVYRDGRVEIQDLASQAIGAVCAPRPGQRWWDACAGGGGKSLLLAQAMQGRGTVVASDIRQHKLDEVRRRARRAGYSNIGTREWKGKALPVNKATFDGVLVDAPCTGSGTWRRNPAARWSVTPATLAERADLQLRLLTHASTAVKPGGVLVYATCSMFRKENDDVVKAFLTGHGDFEPEPIPHPLTDRPTSGLVDIWPWEGDCDAMFAARLRRRAMPKA